MPDTDAPAREMYKATFSNGVEYYLDRHLHAIPTHYGDENGTQHPLVGIERASDDEEVRFVAPDGTSTPAGDQVEDKEARIARLQAELAALTEG